MVTRTTRWIWTERADGTSGGRHIVLVAWRSSGRLWEKARGFTVGLHSKDSLETLGQDS